MLEKEVERAFVKLVKNRGGESYKFVSPGHIGVPDRLVIFPGGKIGFAEIKRPGEKPRANQIRQMDKLRRMGCIVAVVDGMESATEAIGIINWQPGGGKL